VKISNATNKVPNVKVCLYQVIKINTTVNRG